MITDGTVIVEGAGLVGSELNSIGLTGANGFGGEVEGRND